MDLLKKLSVIVGPLLVIFIFSYYITLGEFFAVFQGISPIFLFLSYVLTTFFFFARAYRLHTLLRKSYISLNFFYTLKLYSQANLLGQVTNFLVSDIVNVGVLILSQEKKLRIANIVILTRIFDLTAIFLIFAVTFSLHFTEFRAYTSVPLQPLLLFFFILALIIPIALHYRQRFLTAYHDLRKVFQATFFLNFAYVMLIYGCYALSAWSDTRALNLLLPWSVILLTYASGSLISVIPISIAGVGTRDMLFIFLLGTYHIPAARAVALSTLGFIITLILAVSTLLIIAQLGKRYADRHNH